MNFLSSLNSFETTTAEALQSERESAYFLFVRKVIEPSSALSIVDKFIIQVEAQLEDKGVSLSIDKKAKEYLVSDADSLTQNEINKLLDVVEYNTMIINLELETSLISSLYEEKMQSNIRRTAIFATEDELLQAQVISYNFLKSGCINRGLVSSDEDWIYPNEVNLKDENKMNFSLKIESTIPIGPECMGKLIASILND